MSIITWPYVLRRGHSDNPSDGTCAMDAINWLVHGEHGDAPQCACPVITSYVVNGNDEMPDDVRQRLLPYLHRIAGSRSAEHQATRTRVLALGALRVFAPRALDAVGLVTHAALLRSLPDDIGMTEATTLAIQITQTAKARAGAAVARVMWAAALAASVMAAVTEATRMTAAVHASRAAAMAGAWDEYCRVLDEALNAGPQGEPWSADMVDAKAALYAHTAGRSASVC